MNNLFLIWMLIGAISASYIEAAEAYSVARDHNKNKDNKSNITYIGFKPDLIFLVCMTVSGLFTLAFAIWVYFDIRKGEQQWK